jgi:hypothetical protein
MVSGWSFGKGLNVLYIGVVVLPVIVKARYYENRIFKSIFFIYLTFFLTSLS